MTTPSQERSCEEVRELQKSKHLNQTQKTIEAEDVVMEEDGKLRFKDISNFDSSLWRVQKREELAEKRKKLVLGIDGHDEHTLSEANSIIEKEWQTFISEHTSPVGKAVNFIKGRL